LLQPAAHNDPRDPSPDDGDSHGFVGLLVRAVDSYRNG
jgi:hypothetical protein